MDNDITECNEKVEKTGNKTRLSLFLPPEVTMLEPKASCNNGDYLKKLKLEEETWKQLYKEQKEEKEYKKKLLREIQYKTNFINYKLFDEEEIKYINSGPDIAAFVREAEELQNLVKSVNLQCNEKKRKLNTLLSIIEDACLEMTLCEVNK